jgi:replication factor C subunit 3/5
MQKHTPWVEKYRPYKFDDIVLDTFNRKILMNIIRTGNLPNIILYGPPGTGKTTTIINLIKEYQEEHNEKNKNLVIHLNASDDRGIDVIRNQIISFVQSKTLFITGKKFIVLDEVDYMTKNAQCALRTLIQHCPSNVVFCLICNYISRMDASLQNEFVRLRFSQLPEKNIIDFINKIKKNEEINISTQNIIDLQKIYKSDIRSIINHIQSNCVKNVYGDKKLITPHIWEDLIALIKKSKIKEVVTKIKQMVFNYNIDLKKLLSDFIFYLITNKPYTNNDKWFELFKYTIYNFENSNGSYMIHYFFLELQELYNEE